MKTGPDPRITLSPAELSECMRIGDLRGRMHNAVERHQKGVVGEVALAKFLGDPAFVWWHAHSAFKSAEEFRSIPHDVFDPATGRGFQVRCADKGDHLALYEGDNPDARFVFVRWTKRKDGSAVCTLAGWVLGRDGMTPDTRAKAQALGFDAARWAVHQDDLTPMQEREE